MTYDDPTLYMAHPRPDDGGRPFRVADPASETGQFVIHRGDDYFDVTAELRNIAEHDLYPICKPGDLKTGMRVAVIHRDAVGHRGSDFRTAICNVEDVNMVSGIVDLEVVESRDSNLRVGRRTRLYAWKLRPLDVPWPMFKRQGAGGRPQQLSLF